jgi:hypothetical protein
VTLCSYPACDGSAVSHCDHCDKPFCADHGSAGGDRPEGEEGMQIDVAYPAQCFACGGFNADEE